MSEGPATGLKDEALVRQVAPKLKALYPDWTISDRAAAAEIRYREQELAGTNRRPVSQPD